MLRKNVRKIGMKTLDAVSKMKASSQKKKPSSNLLIAGVTNDSNVILGFLK